MMMELTRRRILGCDAIRKKDEHRHALNVRERSNRACGGPCTINANAAEHGAGSAVLCRIV
jgi:hypothetical protein